MHDNLFRENNGRHYQQHKDQNPLYTSLCLYKPHALQMKSLQGLFANAPGLIFNAFPAQLRLLIITSRDTRTHTHAHPNNCTSTYQFQCSHIANLIIRRYKLLRPWTTVYQGRVKIIKSSSYLRTASDVREIYVFHQSSVRFESFQSYIATSISVTFFTCTYISSHFIKAFKCSKINFNYCFEDTYTLSLGMCTSPIHL